MQLPETIAGTLLAAHPNLLDPNFRRAVLYLAHHTPEEGALGLLLNRHSGKHVGQLIEKPNLGALAQIPVFHGGPVATDKLTFALIGWDDEEETVAFRMNLPLPEAKALAEESDTRLRGYVGYAGWSAGQLEAELEQESWILRPPEKALLQKATPTACKSLWRAMIAPMIAQNEPLSHWFRLLANAPEDPSLN